MLAHEEYTTLTDTEEKFVKLFLILNAVAIVGAAIFGFGLVH